MQYTFQISRNKQTNIKTNTFQILGNKRNTTATTNEQTNKTVRLNNRMIEKQRSQKQTTKLFRFVERLQHRDIYTRKDRQIDNQTNRITD